MIREILIIKNVNLSVDLALKNLEFAQLVWEVIENNLLFANVKMVSTIIMGKILIVWN